MFIDASNPALSIEAETIPLRVAVCASDLGLRPGEWPESIETNIGNGRAFLCNRAQMKDGDLVAVHYGQEFGIFRLTIFND